MRKRIRIALLSVVLLTTAAAAGWYLWLAGGNAYRVTEDAYVHGNQVDVSAQVGGTVVAIGVDDTDLVLRGQPVVRLDDSDARVALQAAEATLGDTLRKVRQFYVNVAQNQASVEARRVELSRAEADYHRRTSVRSGSVSDEEIAHAEDGLEAARAALEAAKQQLASARALVVGTDLQHHPLVMQAEAQVLAADLAAQRTTVRAPESGYVARRSVQLGQRISSGTPLLTIIPLNQVWVDANFREGDLKDMRIGQSARLTADFYGSSVTFSARVVGLAPGTGAAFSLLPPQEASGNWIKIVQRVPVRLAIDADQLRRYPLRLGLSVRARIDTQDRQGAVLAAAPPSASRYATAIYAGEWKRANALVRQLVATNLEALAGDSTRAQSLGEQ